MDFQAQETLESSRLFASPPRLRHSIAMFCSFLHASFWVLSFTRRKLSRAGHRVPLTALTTFLICFILPGAPTLGDRVQLDDGRTLTGSFANVAGIKSAPFADRQKAEATPVLVCDDGLSRVFVPRRRVTAVEQAAEPATERIGIPQRVATGGRVMAQMGGVLEATPFDAWGRRIFSVATPNGREDIVQGITEINPRYVRVEGLITDKPVQMDTRLATSSIPRETLAEVIAQYLDREDANQRLRLVRLYLQAERFEDARTELSGVLRDFPDLEHLADEQKRLARLAAEEILDELTLREAAGQHRLSMQLLDSFPADNADGLVLEQVRERRDRYRDRIAAARSLSEQLKSLAAQIEDTEDRTASLSVIEDITARLSFSTIERFATFDRMTNGDNIPAQRAMAIAINGWLGGATFADDNLKLALSAVRVRDKLQTFLQMADEEDRREIFDDLSQEEAFDAETVTTIARMMPPPSPPGEPIGDGLYCFDLTPIEDQPAVRCLVQLPPEYDPLRSYPVILSMHAAWTTPEQQIDWWAGAVGPRGDRLGQATRHGYVVIAPQWSRKNQTTCSYLASEHAAVLSSLREACRRFSLDTDRVFLSGHSMGADAAWDIALSHPDLWAGVVLIAPTADRYVSRYWENARQLPMYIIGGELDTGRLDANAMDIDRYLRRSFDITYVEFLGRGHENFSDEILRAMDWMGRKQRTFFPKKYDAVSMRPWDRFFWWAEFEGFPPRTVLLPAQWPPGAGYQPATIEAVLTPGNTVNVRSGASRTRVWLSPELVDFSRNLTITVDGERTYRGIPQADLWTLLEDLRLRVDRHHPFWQVVDTTAGP
jgi:predicted esterase